LTRPMRQASGLHRLAGVDQLAGAGLTDEAGSRSVPPPPGNPELTSEGRGRRSRWHAQVAARASSNPRPRQWPSMAAMVGMGKRSIRLYRVCSWTACSRTARGDHVGKLLDVRPKRRPAPPAPWRRRQRMAGSARSPPGRRGSPPSSRGEGVQGGPVDGEVATRSRTPAHDDASADRSCGFLHSSAPRVSPRPMRLPGPGTCPTLPWVFSVIKAGRPAGLLIV